MLLQISIPTFNRFGSLQPLLNALKCQIAQLDCSVDVCRVVVFDNCSTDNDYSNFVHHDVFKLNHFEYVRHSKSLGMEGNILCCYERAQADYVWIFGDDDMPAQGLIGAVVDLLKSANPDMVYIDSKWVDQGDVFATASSLTVPEQWSFVTTAIELARSAGTSLTFLSSVVISKTVLMRSGVSSSALLGTQMPQMAWVLSALTQDAKLVKSTGQCIVASKGNSGGYKVLDVFACHYPNALREFERYMQPGVSTALRCELIQNYLPGLIYQLKNQSLGRFDSTESMPSTSTLGVYSSYNVLKWMHDKANARLFRLYAFLSKVVYRLSCAVRIGSRSMRN